MIETYDLVDAVFKIYGPCSMFLGSLEPQVVHWQPGNPPFRVYSKYAASIVQTAILHYAKTKNKEMLALVDVLLRGANDAERYEILEIRGHKNPLQMAMNIPCYELMKILLMHGAAVPSNIAAMTAVNANVTTLVPISMSSWPIEKQQDQIAVLIMQLHLVCPLQVPDEPYFVTNRRSSSSNRKTAADSSSLPLPPPNHPKLVPFEYNGFDMLDVHSIVVRNGSSQPLIDHIMAMMDSKNENAFSSTRRAIDYVETLADLGGLPTTMLPSMAGSVLHTAIAFGHKEIVDMMLQKWNLRGTLLNYLSRHGMTPLTLAAKMGEHEILQMLVKRGACAAMITFDSKK